MSRETLLKRVWRKWLSLNLRISRWQSSVALRLLPRTNGMGDFLHRAVPGLLRPGMRILEVGSGRWPLIPAEYVRVLRLHVVGLDISAEELRAAPEGAYQQVIVGDVAETPLDGPFDLILSRAVLEHVRDNRRAIANLAGAMAPGGVMAHFVPCGNAPFALLNRAMGNRLAQRALFGIYPERQRLAGFPAYYDHCVPSRLAQLCRRCGLEIAEVTPYFISDYFELLAPLHAVDLCRQMLCTLLRAQDVAESFVLVARKPAGAACRPAAAA